VAGRFPLLTDIHVHDALVEALRGATWDVLRAVDVLPSNADDEVLFGYAAEHDRVLVTNDRPLEAIAIRWMREGRDFRGLVCWPQKHYRTMTDGQLAQAFDRIAVKPNAFAYPIEYIKPEQPDA
jgi:hypothetical protein